MDLSEILKLMEYQCSTQICVEGFHDAFFHCDSLKLTPDQSLHHSAFCRTQKLADGNQKCSRNKGKTLKLAEHGRAFCGVCPAGVRELVQPVLFHGELAAVCYLTIQQSTIPLPELRKRSSWLADYILLVLSAFSVSGKGCRKQNSREYYQKKCRNYLDLHYMDNIGEADLADYLKLNPKYCSSLFRDVMGLRFRQALTERRIHEAKIYLRLHRSLSIAFIARLCGFSDGNYFSLVFHRTCGMSPKAFRNAPGISLENSEKANDSH